MSSPAVIFFFLKKLSIFNQTFRINGTQYLLLNNCTIFDQKITQTMDICKMHIFTCEMSKSGSAFSIYSQKPTSKVKTPNL